MQTEKEYTSERSILGLHCESVGEYPLPDYNGDVKRVLMISPRVSSTGKYMNESNLEFSGNVFYDVVYLDSENNITHTEFSTDYELAVKQDSERYEDSCVATSISSYNVRLVGPRKFSAKASLSSDVRILERNTLEIQGDALDSESAETLTKDADILSSLLLTGEQSELKDDSVFVAGAIEDEVQLLACDVVCGEVAVMCDGTSAELKCDLAVRLLYKNGYEPMCTRVLNLPCSASFESEDLEGCTSLFGKMDISDVKTELNPTDDGVGIICNVSLLPSLRGVKNESVPVVLDAYLRDRGTSNEYRDFVYNEHICSGSLDKAFSTRLPLSDVTDADVCEIISCDCVAAREGCDVTDDGVCVKGELRFNALAKEENENGENYINLKFSVPFEQIVNMNCQIHDNMRAESYIEVYGEMADVADGHINVSCNIYSHVSVNAQRKMRCLGASYLTDEEYSSEDSVITVYYPDDRESVFDIAKRHHASVRKISEDNSLSEAVFNSKDAPVRSFGYKKILIK